jgi:hypothetical protein
MSTALPFTPCAGVVQAWAVSSVTVPDPLVTGQSLAIVLAGPLSITVSQGANCVITGTLGDAVVMSLTKDLCAMAAEQGQPCPISARPDWRLSIPLDLGDVPPFVSLNLRLEATNADGAPLTCLGTTIKLQPHVPDRQRNEPGHSRQ